MNTTMNKSLCVLRTLFKHKPKCAKCSLIFSKDGLQNGKRHNFCRRLATAPSNDAKEKAFAEIGSRFTPGLGIKESVDDYTHYAKEYDELVGTTDFSGPIALADAVGSILKDNKSAKILDAGAGTGLGGVALYNSGFTNLDAVDASSGLLEVAKAKNIYNKVICHFLGNEPLPVEDDTYDMVTLCGAMGENHIPTEAIDDLIRIVKPGGHIVNVFRELHLSAPMYGDGLESHFEKVEKMGKWKLLEKTRVPNFLYAMDGVMFVHRVI